MVNITKFAVRRPITIVLCLITIAYFGVQSLLGTKLELTPEMEMPMLVIATVYAGASPEDVNDLITVNRRTPSRPWTEWTRSNPTPRKMWLWC